MGQSIFYELTRAWAYRRIVHPRIVIYTRTLPAILLAITLTVWFFLPVKPALLGQPSLSASTLAIMSTLPGFYFAGLAAVATFGGLNMDKVMNAPAPKLKTAVTSGFIENDLTNRQFLSYLFSYLVVLSFAISGILMVLANFDGALIFIGNVISKTEIGSNIWLAFSWLGGGVVVALISSMIVSTLHAVFFLSEKIHQP